VSTAIARSSVTEIRTSKNWITSQERDLISKDFYRHSLSRQGWTAGDTPVFFLSYDQCRPPYFEDKLTSQIENALFSIRLKDILISQPANVREYLMAFPDMIDLLSFACEKAWERFSVGDYQLSVEVYSDPEIEDEHLVIYVRQSHYDEHIMDAIEKTRTQYAEQLAWRSGWLHLTTDFQPPIAVKKHGL
jgi:hypothetical protein